METKTMMRMVKILVALLVVVLLGAGRALAQTPPSGTYGFDFLPNDSLGVSATGHARIRYNSGTGVFEQSLSGGAWTTLGGASTLAGAYNAAVSQTDNTLNLNATGLGLILNGYAGQTVPHLTINDNNGISGISLAATVADTGSPAIHLKGININSASQDFYIWSDPVTEGNPFPALRFDYGAIGTEVFRIQPSGSNVAIGSAGGGDLQILSGALNVAQFSHGTTAPAISSGIAVYLPTATTPTIAPPSGGKISLATGSFGSIAVDAAVGSTVNWGAMGIKVTGGGVQVTGGPVFGTEQAYNWSTASPTQINPINGGAQIRINMQANVTSWSIANGGAWEQIDLVFVQDATGSRTLAGAGGTIKWAPSTYHGTDHSAPTLSTAPNARDTFGFQWDGTNWVETFRNMNN